MSVPGGDQYVRSLEQWLGPQSHSIPGLDQVFAWAEALDEAASPAEFWVCHGELRSWIGSAVEDDSTPPEVQSRLRSYLALLETAASQSGQPVELSGEQTLLQRISGILQINATGVHQITELLDAAAAVDAADDDDAVAKLGRVYDLARATLESGHALGLTKQLRLLVAELADFRD